jgi:hypothetical protein
MKKTNPLAMAGLATALFLGGCKKDDNSTLLPPTGPGTVQPQGIIEDGWNLNQVDVYLTQFYAMGQQLDLANRVVDAPPYEIVMTFARNGNDQLMRIWGRTSNLLNVENIGTLYDPMNNPNAGQFVDGVVHFGDIDYQSASSATVGNSTLRQAGNPTFCHVSNVTSGLPEQQIQGFDYNSNGQPILFRLWVTNPVTQAVVNPSNTEELVENYIQNRDIYIGGNLGADCISNNPNIVSPLNNDGLTHRVRETETPGFYNCEYMFRQIVQ